MFCRRLLNGKTLRRRHVHVRVNTSSRNKIHATIARIDIHLDTYSNYNAQKDTNMSESSRRTSLEEDLDKCQINESDGQLHPSASAPIHVTGKFGKARQTKLDAIVRLSANITDRLQTKNHYLIPIGSVRQGTDSKSSPKHIRWIDVASIMNQGTTLHRVIMYIVYMYVLSNIKNLYITDLHFA